MKTNILNSIIYNQSSIWLLTQKVLSFINILCTYKFQNYFAEGEYFFEIYTYVHKILIKDKTF
jgi:hypothetical protein